MTYEISKATFVAGSSRLFGIVLSYLLTYYVSFFYDVSSLGRLFSTIAMLQIVSIICKMGLDSLILKELPSSPNKKSVISNFQIAVLASSGLIVLTGLFFTWVLWKYDVLSEGTRNWSMFTLLGILPFSVLGLNLEIIRAEMKVLEYSYLKNSAILAITLVILFVLPNGFVNEIEPFMSYIFGVFLLYGITHMSIKRKFSDRLEPFKELRLGNLSNSVRKGMNYMMASSALLSLNWIDTLMVRSYLGEECVGYYTIGIKVGTIVSLILMATNTYVVPKIASNINLKGNKSLLKLMVKTGRLNVLVSLLMTIFIFIFLNNILGLFIDGKVGDTKNVVVCICVGQLINSIFGPTLFLLQYSGNEKLYRNIMIISVSLSIVLNLIMIPLFGILGAAIGTTLTIVVWNLWSWYYSKKLLSIDTISLIFNKDA